MDCKYTTYLDRWKWWGPSLLIHALVAAAFLYPFTQGKDTANSDDALHAIAIVFAPETQIPTAPVTSPFVSAFAVSKIGAGGIVTVTGRLFGKCCGVAISDDSTSVFPGFAGPLSVIWVALDVTLGVAVVDWCDGSFGL